MTLQITGKNLDVGEALRTYLTERVDQALEKYVGAPLSGHIRIEKERSQFLTDCSIQLKSGFHIQAHGQSNDAYASADAALERLEKRLRRYKRRLKKHHGPTHEAASGIEATSYVIQHDEEEDDSAQAEDDAPIIIAEMQTIIRELPVSDAVMQMNLSERPFLIFRNASHGQINVVYRRPDGNIGWIDPNGAHTQSKAV